jgi:hypothetical protein
MNLFESLVNLSIEHPSISGTIGVFIIAVLAELLGLRGLASLLLVIGIGLATLEVFLRTRN